MGFITKLKKCWAILREPKERKQEEPSRELKEKRAEAEKWLKIRRNVDAYDGTSKNQERI